MALQSIPPTICDSSAALEVGETEAHPLGRSTELIVPWSMALALFATEAIKTSYNSNRDDTGPIDCGDHDIPSQFPAINQSELVEIHNEWPREKTYY
jgi:hypothetical protein